MEWIPLFYSETSGRYFYFGKEREILFVMPPKVDDDRSEPVASEGQETADRRKQRPLVWEKALATDVRGRERPANVSGPV